MLYTWTLPSTYLGTPLDPKPLTSFDPIHLLYSYMDPLGLRLGIQLGVRLTSPPWTRGTRDQELDSIPRGLP